MRETLDARRRFLLELRNKHYWCERRFGIPVRPQEPDQLRLFHRYAGFLDNYLNSHSMFIAFLKQFHKQFLAFLKACEKRAARRPSIPECDRRSRS